MESGTVVGMYGRVVLRFTLTLMDTTTLKCVEWLKHTNTVNQRDFIIQGHLQLQIPSTTYMGFL